MANFDIACEVLMDEYEKTAQRNAEQTQIAESIEFFRRKLDAKATKEFNSLLDNVNNSDAKAVYEAFKFGCCFATWIFSASK